MARPSHFARQTCEQTFGLSDICTRPTRYQLIWTRFHLAHTQPSVTGVNGLPGRTYNSSPTSIRRLQRKLTRQGVCLPGTNIFGFYGIGFRRNRGFGRSPIPNLEHRFHTKFVNDHEGKISSRVVENTGLENEYCIKKGRKKKYISTYYHPFCLLSTDGIFKYLMEN